MFEKNEIIVWDAGEIIYRAGDKSDEAYLIVEGSAELFTDDGLRLNQIGVNEILGETSILLGTNRTVTAAASSVGAKAKRIPRQYFADLSNRDKVAAALMRKTQYRLIDSNRQSNALGLELDTISRLLGQLSDLLDSRDPVVIELHQRLAEIKKTLTIDRHLAAYPTTGTHQQSESETADEFG